MEEMRIARLWSGIILAALFTAGCSHAPTIALPGIPTATPTIALPPLQTTISGCPAPPAALDDRSTATNIVLSYYNALNRQDYQRAYGYLSPLTPLPSPTPPPANPPFAQWKAGYAQTACDIVTYHGAEAPVTSATAGYAGIGTGIAIPISLTAVLNDGTIQQFVGIYAIRYAPAQGISATGYIDLTYSQLNPA
jgi:hypothetical protein